MDSYGLRAVTMWDCLRGITLLKHYGPEGRVDGIFEVGRLAGDSSSKRVRLWKSARVDLLATCGGRPPGKV